VKRSILFKKTQNNFSVIKCGTFLRSVNFCSPFSPSVPLLLVTRHISHRSLDTFRLPWRNWHEDMPSTWAIKVAGDSGCFCSCCSWWLKNSYKFFTPNCQNGSRQQIEMLISKFRASNGPSAVRWAWDPRWAKVPRIVINLSLQSMTLIRGWCFGSLVVLYVCSIWPWCSCEGEVMSSAVQRH